MFADVFAILVYQGGLDPEYVLDRMSIFELHILIQKLYYAHIDSWEQTRQLAFISAKVMGGIKSNDPKKFMPFSWDSIEKEKLSDTEKPTKEDRERLINKAKEYLKNGTRISY